MKRLSRITRVGITIAVMILPFWVLSQAVADPLNACYGLANAAYNLDDNCIAECDLKKKVKKFNQAIKLQNKLDIFGCPAEFISTYESLCGGLMDAEYTGVDVYPQQATLSLEEGEDSIQLTAEFYGTPCKDGLASYGALHWFSSDPGVATVTQDGFVTATGDGSASITAISVDFQDISSSAQITVGEEEPIECDADGDGRLDEAVYLASIYCAEGSIGPYPSILELNCGITDCPGTEGINYICMVCGNLDTWEVQETRSGFCPVGGMVPCMYWGNLTPVQ